MGWNLSSKDPGNYYNPDAKITLRKLSAPHYLCNSDIIEIRESPNFSSDVIARIMANQKVFVELKKGPENDFYQIVYRLKVRGPLVGYVPLEDLCVGYTSLLRCPTCI